MPISKEVSWTAAPLPPENTAKTTAVSTAAQATEQAGKAADSSAKADMKCLHNTAGRQAARQLSLLFAANPAVTSLAADTKSDLADLYAKSVNAILFFTSEDVIITAPINMLQL